MLADQRLGLRGELNCGADFARFDLLNQNSLISLGNLSGAAAFAALHAASTVARALDDSCHGGLSYLQCLGDFAGQLSTRKTRHHGGGHTKRQSLHAAA